MAGSGHGNGMIRTILIWAAVIIVILLIGLWFVTGGVGRVIGSAKGMANSLNIIFFGAPTAGEFRLPWQPDNMVRGPILDFPEEGGEQLSPEEEAAAREAEYEAQKREAESAKVFGQPSPYRGLVYLGAAAATETGNAEYLELEASSQNTSPVSIAGWSLQSALTGIRAPIPRGTRVFILGNLNSQEDISLSPGATAVLSSRFSPVGTSFRENLCTGYLAGLQNFTPSLSRTCPPPTEALPPTPDNIKAYGDSCIDFVASLPSCSFPSSPSGSLSPNCRIFLSNTFSYNGCVQTNGYRSNFLRDSWRIYLGSSSDLWRDTHDVIRLLDAEGRTVDAVSY